MKRGRPKGYSPYTTISYEELGDWVGRKTKVVVCKKWLESLIEPTDEPKTELLTEPKPKPPQESPSTSEVESKIEYNITHF
jgi:hypothetical protein